MFKKLIFFMAIMMLTLLPVGLSSCSDDEKSFDYPMETLYGTWNGTAVLVDGEWLDLTSWIIPAKYRFSITFNEDGTYYGEGFLGTGKGTYEASGDMIYTYVSGKEYLRYKVKSLSGNIAEITMYDNSGDSIDAKVKKK